jgi:hypothetical protein
MCASTLVLLRIPTVHYAAADPVFEGAHEHLGRLAYCEDRLPDRSGPLDGPVSAFAALLPLAFNIVVDSWVVAEHRARDPALVALAEDLVAGHRLSIVAGDGGGAGDALAALWDDLEGLSPASPPPARR